MIDYRRAEALGYVQYNRWEEGKPHHPMSIRLMKFLAEHDQKDWATYFDWRIGGDGDNGELLMYQMDAFFEQMDFHSQEITAPTPPTGGNEGT